MCIQLLLIIKNRIILNILIKNLFNSYMHTDINVVDNNLYLSNMKSLFAKTDNSVFWKSCFVLCYHVFIVLLCSLAECFLLFLLNKNNPTAVLLRLIGIQDEKKNMIFDNCQSVFANELFI